MTDMRKGYVDQFPLKKGELYPNHSIEKVAVDLTQTICNGSYIERDKMIGKNNKELYQAIRALPEELVSDDTEIIQSVSLIANHPERCPMQFLDGKWHEIR